MPVHDDPSRRTRRNRSLSDPLAVYRSRYAGVTRGRLKQEDPSLYATLRVRGLLSHVPLRQRRRRIGSDPLGYCRRHYPGITRGALHARDPSLYNQMRLKGLLENLPEMTDPSAWHNYCLNYHGLDADELLLRNPALHGRLARAGHLGRLPPACRKRRPRG